MNQEKIGKFIAELRKEKNLTQEQLAQKLNITKNAVSKWERGLCLMDMSLLKPLSSVRGVSVSEVISGEHITNDNLLNKTEEVVVESFNYSTTKLKKYRQRTIVSLIIIILAIPFILGIVDYNRIKNNLNPIFMLHVSTSESKSLYLGVGYKMIREIAKYSKELLREDLKVRFGLWFYDWEVDVIKAHPEDL